MASDWPLINLSLWPLIAFELPFKCALPFPCVPVIDVQRLACREGFSRAAGHVALWGFGLVPTGECEGMQMLMSACASAA